MGAAPERAQAARDGMTVALRHLVLRRDREAGAEIDEGSWSCSSVRLLPCTMLMCGPTRPLRISLSQPPGVLASPPPWCMEATRPMFDGEREVVALTSSVE